MLPSGVQLMLAPLDSSLLYDEEGPGDWRNPVHGIDFSYLETLELRQAIAAKTIVVPEDLLAEGKPIIELDLATAKASDQWQSGKVSFIATRDGRLDGFAGWFVAELSPSVSLDTGPYHPVTHWKQSCFHIRPLLVEKGQRIEVEYSLAKHPVEPRSLEFRLKVESQSYDFTVG